MAGILDYEHITKDYGVPWSQRRVRALTDFSLSLERGEIFGFLGPNGAGKTTAIHLALGFMRPSAGSGRMLGMPFGHARTRARIGFLAENVALYHRRASTLLRFYGGLNRVPEARLRQRCREVLEEVDLYAERDRNVAKLSRGMQQRIGLAQALVSDPELLILDEPTSALDPGSRAAMRELLLEANRAGMTIFLSSHLLSEIEMICDRVAILARGRLRQLGRTEELLLSRDRYEIVARVPQVRVPGLDANLGPPTQLPGDHVRLTVDAPSQRDAIEKIWAAGGEVLSVNPVRRTLEEVFLELTAEGDPA